MHMTHGIAEQTEAPANIFSDAAVHNAMTIEQLLNRANEIRRARGGLFGYDFEDWLQATRELSEERAARRPSHSSEYRPYDCEEC